jgi:hypothetical protein
VNARSRPEVLLAILMGAAAVALASGAALRLPANHALHAAADDLAIAAAIAGLVGLGLGSAPGLAGGRPVLALGPLALLASLAAAYAFDRQSGFAAPGGFPVWAAAALVGLASALVVTQPVAARAESVGPRFPVGLSAGVALVLLVAAALGLQAPGSPPAMVAALVVVALAPGLAVGRLLLAPATPVSTRLAWAPPLSFAALVLAMAWCDLLGIPLGRPGLVLALVLLSMPALFPGRAR